jgi:phage-related protein
MNPPGKPLAWLRGEIKTPPLTTEARVEAGYLLRQVQLGLPVGMPHSRPMPVIGRRCHELRVKYQDISWRIVYRIDSDAIVIVEVFGKTSRTTPARLIAVCKRRLREYDDAR